MRKQGDLNDWFGDPFEDLRETGEICKLQPFAIHIKPQECGCKWVEKEEGGRYIANAER